MHTKKYLISRIVFLWVLLPLGGLAFLILAFSAVNNDLTEEDRKYIPFYLAGITPLATDRNYDDELRYIAAVQRAVLNIAPMGEGIPQSQLREPKQLYLAKQGLCFDRSRVIEKILRYSGFKTRHIALYTMKETKSALKALLTPGVSSHAISEVFTKKGWLVVGSNSLWLSLDAEENPVSISLLQYRNANGIVTNWKVEPKSNIYLMPFTYLFGLYSRHGKFYPPYNRIPDINYQEFIQNIEI